MGTGIYLIGQNEELIQLPQVPYDSEDLLQRLLERYPSVLAGDQINPSSPRRWLLITREMPVPAEKDGAGRWSLDHLFLDQDGVPTLVEVKRSTDTRIRREVVGQMLDYAANAVIYLPVEALQAAFRERCAQSSLDPAQELSAFLPPDGSSDAFWQTVKLNLQAGRIRLVFVADEVPLELRRIVEFLNEQMDPAEVLAVEIRQYVGGGMRSLVPQVFGRTEEARVRKSATGVARQWNEESFFAELESRSGPANAQVARQILSWARRRNARLEFNKSPKDGGISVFFEHNGTATYPITLWTYGKVEFQFQLLRDTSAFADAETRKEMQRRLNAIPGISISDEAIEKRPNIVFATFQNSHAYKQLEEVLDWVVSQLLQV